MAQAARRPPMAWGGIVTQKLKVLYLTWTSILTWRRPSVARCQRPGGLVAVREDNIRATQLRLIARSPVALLGALLAGAFAVAVLWSYLDRRWLLAWAASLLIITMVRLAMWFRFRRIAHEDARVIRWLWPLTIAVSITGLIWGLFGVCFYLVSD